MNSLDPAAMAEESVARCALHPEHAATGTCSRCGSFFCEEDRRSVDERDYCAPCAERPDVDPVEAFRNESWGKRDGWAWFFMLTAPLNLVLGLVAIQQGEENLLAGLLALARVVLSVCFWLGIPFTRVGMIVLSVGSALASVALVGAEGLRGAVMPILFAVLMYQDPRNKLFFKLEVPREQLKKAWERRANNMLARVGLRLGLLGVLLPVFAPFALLCSIIGLRRVDLTARPPIGRKGQAIAGIVLGALGTVWGGVLLALFLRR